MANIAFIGLGNMGRGMCRNLLEAGHSVKAYDVSSAAVEAMVQYGASVADSVATAVEEADFVVTMLPSGRHVLDVYFGSDGAAGKAPAGAVFIDCSTISVDESRDAIVRASLLGFDMLDAPVSGGVGAADAGTLTFMVGGERRAFAMAEPILKIMGKKIVHAGGAGNGQAAKIANNMLLGISMIGTCEAFNLAQKLGLDAQTFFEISSTASGQCWAMTSYCPAPGPVPAAPSNRDYQPGFAVAMMLKDLKLATGAAALAGAETPLGHLAESIYAKLDDDGHSGLDFSAVMKRIQGEL